MARGGVMRLLSSCLVREMPVLDIMVLFAAADSRDSRHSRALKYVRKLSEEGYMLSCCSA